MAHLNTEAIVLHARDFAEHDRIVSLYSREFGRIQGIAKNAKRSRKRFGGALEPFSHVNSFVTIKENQGLVRLERCDILRVFPELALDMQKLLFGTYFLELVYRLCPERQRSPAVFSLLLGFITRLAERACRQDLVQLYVLRFFELLGYQPQFSACVRCREVFVIDRPYVFSVSGGGIVCPACRSRQADGLPLSAGTIRVFQQAQHMALEKLDRIHLSPEARAEGTRILEGFLEYHIGTKIRSLQVIEQFGRGRPNFSVEGIV